MQQPPEYPHQQPPMPGQPFYPPQPPPAPVRKKSKKGLIIGAIIAFFVIFACIFTINMVTHSNASTTTANTGSSNTTGTANQPASAASWKTVQTFSGNGIKKTPVFTVPGDWRINYTCQGQNIGGITADGVLAVTVYNSDGTLVDVAINATCKAGKTTKDSTEEHQSGTVYLDANSTGDWTMTVQALQ